MWLRSSEAYLLRLVSPWPHEKSTHVGAMFPRDQVIFLNGWLSFSLPQMGFSLCIAWWVFPRWIASRSARCYPLGESRCEKQPNILDAEYRSCKPISWVFELLWTSKINWQDIIHLRMKEGSANHHNNPKMPWTDIRAKHVCVNKVSDQQKPCPVRYSI